MERYQTEAAYLQSVLLWLQRHWTKPDPPRFYPLREAEQGSRQYPGRNHAAFNRRDVIIDLPDSCHPEAPYPEEAYDSTFGKEKIAAGGRQRRGRTNKSLRSIHGLFALNEVSSYRESLRAWNVSCSSPAGGINDEGKDARRRVKHNRYAKASFCSVRL